MRKRRGYTLVEALISLAVLSVVMLGVYGVLQTANAVTAKDTALLEAQQQGRNAIERMVKEVRASSAAAVTVLSADSDRLTFTIPTATGVQYALSGTNIVRTYPAGTNKIIATDIGRLKFAIAGSSLTITVRADKVLFSQTVSYSLVQKVRLRNE